MIQVRLFFKVLLFSLSFVGASHAGILGKYAVYERGSEVWLVGEVLNVNDLETRGSKSSQVRSAILVVSCSVSGRCQIQTLQDDPGEKWIPVLTWEDDAPVLLSADFKSGVTMETSERRVVSIVGLDAIPDISSEWQLNGGELPEPIVARNRNNFGVTRVVSGGAMGAAMGDKIELTLWNVSIGNKQSDLTCNTITFRSRQAGADMLRVVYGIGF
jgi:hypothetical protein